MTTHIDAATLTTFDVHPEGTHVRINVRDQAGLPASLVLPATCANQLMMTLPRIVEVALRNNQKNEALRLVHPLACVYLEGGEDTSDGTRQFIMTIDTGSGFYASFTVSKSILETLASTIVNEVMKHEPPAAALTTH